MQFKGKFVRLELYTLYITYLIFQIKNKQEERLIFYLKKAET